MPKVRALPLLATLLAVLAGCGSETRVDSNPKGPEELASSDSTLTSTTPTATWSTAGQVATYVVPAGKNQAEFQLWGGGGGGGAPGGGGGGAWVNASFPVAPGDSIEVRVASGGAAYGGGGGASYVLRNGQLMIIAGGGGGGGVDGCNGCSKETDALAGAGGAAGPAGGNGVSGRANNYVQTNSGGGGGGTQTAGGAAGLSNDQNPYGYTECTSPGLRGAANQGGAARVCTGGTYTAAYYQQGGQGIGNGSGGGGGAGRYGGGSGALKWTYTGGGGGGGSSWVNTGVTLISTAGGNARQPGGTSSADYVSTVGLGGAPQTDSLGAIPQAGSPGRITLRMTKVYTAPTATWSTGGQVATYVVPAGKNQAEFQLWGGGGGGGAPGGGGGGAWVNASFPVVAGDTLEVRVASGGAAYGGGGGASYVLRNGQLMIIAGGGGGGGVDGCGGCTKETDTLAGAGGAGGAVGGNGVSGRANNYVQTNSGGGGGGTQTAGGAAGLSNDQNPYGYDECTSPGFPGAANQGGAARVCADSSYTAASYQLGGQGIGNGSGGGGGAGRYGGGSGGHKWTYTGGGGGGGSSWIASGVTLISTAAGNARQPGGTSSADYGSSVGLGGAPQTDSFGTPAQAGAPGRVILRLTGLTTVPTATWSTGGQTATYVVPTGKTRAEFQLWGGGGGGGAPGAGGGGAWVNASFPVVAGDTLEVRVAGGGAAGGGGGGASYVLRNGQFMIIAAGGGGGGVDGCSGCTKTTDALAGAGGAGGAAGGNGQSGRPNNYVQTNSGGGGGGTQVVGGPPGMSHDQNPYGYSGCTSIGFPGAANQGGAARMCAGSSYTAASYQLGGQGSSNGSGGGGGAGRYGGGSGGQKWTYTGGGGGGGSSWVNTGVTLLGTAGGSAQQPGGTYSVDYASSAGLGGAPQTDSLGTPPKAGSPGRVTLRL